jgi:hypothetical protein
MTMTPIHDRKGRPIAWYAEKKALVSYRGRYVAVIRDDKVYTMSGVYLGRFKKGFFRDRHGGAVAFVEGATGGPTLPVRAVAPVAPVLPVAPVTPVLPVAPVAPVASLSWGAEWDAFLSGR